MVLGLYFLSFLLKGAGSWQSSGQTTGIRIIIRGRNSISLRHKVVASQKWRQKYDKLENIFLTVLNVQCNHFLCWITYTSWESMWGHLCLIETVHCEHAIYVSLRCRKIWYYLWGTIEKGVFYRRYFHIHCQLKRVRCRAKSKMAFLKIETPHAEN